MQIVSWVCLYLQDSYQCEQNVCTNSLYELFSQVCISDGPNADFGVLRNSSQVNKQFYQERKKGPKQRSLLSGWGGRLLPKTWERQPAVIPFTPSWSVTNFLLWHLLLLHLVVYCLEMLSINRNPWVEAYGGLIFSPLAPFSCQCCLLFLMKCLDSVWFCSILPSKHP